MMEKSSKIPLLEPSIFKEKLIDNKWNRILNNREINNFFIHSFKEDLISLKLPLPPHKKTVNDFILIIRGRMTKTIGVESFTLKANEFLFTPKNSITTSKNIDEENEGFYCHFSDDFLARNPYLKLWHTQAIAHNLLALTDAQMQDLLPLLKRMNTLYREIKLKPSNYQLIKQYLSTFIAEVSVLAQEQYSRANIHPTISIFYQLVTERFKQHKMVSYYAELIHISPNHLNKTIKKETGKTASEIIHQVCILEAKVLLTQTSLDINEIALELGYEDSSYFSRFFKKYTGSAPSKYRRMIDLS